MKAIIKITISILLLISCTDGEELFFNPGYPKNGDVSFTINGQKYSSPLSWSITLIQNVNPVHDDVSELTIKDTLGFNFSHILLLNHSEICGIVIPVAYKDPKYNSIYYRDENDSCFVFRSDGEDGLNEMDSLVMFEVINGNFDTKLINCKTNCGKGLLSGLYSCTKYCDLEGTFSFEAKNGYGASMYVSDGHYIAYNRYIY